MKEKSDFVKGVLRERWKTPIMHNDQLWLHFILQTITGIHFFFTLDQEEEIHIMTIDSGTPYRFTDESLGYHCIGRYFRTKKPFNSKIKRCSTWKLWNTSFILDLETGNALSGYAKKRDKNYFEYLISSQDEYIEFVTPTPPVWELRKNVKIDKLINEYVKKAL
ncbi:MAG: hypothetical protein PHY93_09600 [Bacteriovorax sp.]|nr:hypothetical protein [Bacteriovorax sp.]